VRLKSWMVQFGNVTPSALPQYATAILRSSASINSSKARLNLEKPLIDPVVVVGSDLEPPALFRYSASLFQGAVLALSSRVVRA
jgi:hypothetical protein